MNAEETVRRVLAWAARACEPTPDNAAPQSMPAGPLWHASALASPSEVIVAELAELTRRLAARLGAGSPPFGDRSPIGFGAVLMGAAVGGRGQPGVARLLAEALPARLDGDTGWTDGLARHAILAPALTELHRTRITDGDEPLAETLLRCSPLTVVLCRPPLTWLTQSATSGAVATARALQARPRGTAVLIAAFAEPASDPAVLTWRAELLGRTLPERPEFLADVYLAARLRHGKRWDEQVARARRAFLEISGPDELSIAVARFWLPLSLLRRRRPDLIRARPSMTGHQAAMALVEGRHRASIAAAS